MPSTSTRLRAPRPRSAFAGDGHPLARTLANPLPERRELRIGFEHDAQGELAGLGFFLVECVGHPDELGYVPSIEQIAELTGALPQATSDAIDGALRARGGAVADVTAAAVGSSPC
jgi:hypothetical protein